MKTSDLLIVAVIGAAAYFFLKSQASAAPSPLATLLTGQRYPGYQYDPNTGDYVDLKTGQHLMVD